MKEDRHPGRLIGRVQAGVGDAARWLGRFNAEYSRKVGMPVFPGSLNLLLPRPFDWFAPDIQARTLWFGMNEYGGERDILLVRCVLENLRREPAFLWTTTTAAQDRPDARVLELIAGLHLRSTYGLADGDEVSIRLHDPGES